MASYLHVPVGITPFIGDACPSAPTSPPSPTQTPVTTTTKPVVDLSRLPKAFEPLVYEVFLRPDFYSQEPSEFYVTGNTTIHVHCHETRAKVILHARDMELTEGNIYKIIDIQYRDHTCFFMH